MRAQNGFIGLITLLLLLLPVVSMAQEVLKIYAPPTPSSIPVILAARNMENAEITIFSNHSQAHTLFLRDDIQMLVTGLSVGVNFFQNGVPVQIINSYVSGVTDLITRDTQVQSFKELRGKEIYLPFEGAPIEEITAFFVAQEGLSLKEDFKVIYAPFESSFELLKQGKAQIVPLPQPLATVAAAQNGIFLSFGYKERWDALTRTSNGYPQVGVFVKKAWADAHSDMIRTFHQKLTSALQLLAEDPELAIELTKSSFKFPKNVLLNSLRRTTFFLSTSQQLVQDMTNYYSILGKPLDETFDSFFYIDQK